MPRLLAPLTERHTYALTLHLLLGLVVGTALFTVFTTLVATGASLLFTLVGLPLLTATFHLARIAGAVERRRLHAFLGVKLLAPARRPNDGGIWQRLVAPFRDETTWRQLTYVWLIHPAQAVVSFTVAVTAWAMPLWAITLPFYAIQHPAAAPELWSGRHLDTWTEVLPAVAAGLVGLVLAPWVIRALAAAEVAAARWGLEQTRVAPSPPSPRSRTDAHAQYRPSDGAPAFEFKANTRQNVPA
jgi:hypothetical protein